jgi:hypothetical protein
MLCLEKRRLQGDIIKVFKIGILPRQLKQIEGHGEESQRTSHVGHVGQYGPTSSEEDPGIRILSK